MKENPKDIDIFTFVDWEPYELRLKAFENVWGFNAENQGLDAYIAANYRESHAGQQGYSVLKTVGRKLLQTTGLKKRKVF